MSDFLYRLDLYWLELINVRFGNPWLDLFWYELTDMHKQMWFKFGLAPLIVIGMAYIYRLGALKMAIALFIAVAVSDNLAYRGIKQNFDRPRPFQNSELSWVRKLSDAHGNSFPSNHAANIFAGAATLAWFLPGGAYAFYIFAGFIAVSRVALGVHYPSDALAGMLLGLIVAFVIRIFLLNRVRWFRLAKSVPTSDAISSSDRTRSRRLQ